MNELSRECYKCKNEIAINIDNIKGIIIITKTVLSNRPQDFPKKILKHETNGNMRWSM